MNVTKKFHDESHALLVISYYAKRSIEPLLNLLGKLSEEPDTASFQVCVVVNRVNTDEVNLDFPKLTLDIVYRDNIGMNIGAWDHGWRQYNNFSFALFLQDDCYVVRNGWLKAISEKLKQPNVGLIGESMNLDWDLNWERLREREKNVRMPEHNFNQGSENRVDNYLSNFDRWGVDRGSTGVHLRALCWAATRETLLAIDGFPVGSDYGECIASEIATTKKVEQINRRIQTIAANPFYYFGHMEWNQATAGGEYSKLGARDKELKKLQDENERFREQLRRVEALSNSSKSRQLLMILSGRFSAQLKRLINKTE